MVKNKIHSRVLSADLDYHRPNFFYRLVTSQRFLAIIGLIFLVVIIFPLARTYSQRRLVEQEIAGVQNQISDYEQQNQQLQELLTYIQSDQSLEEQARLNLNLKKPGEAVVVVEDQKTASTAVGTVATGSAANNLIKWWRYFFN